MLEKSKSYSSMTSTILEWVKSLNWSETNVRGVAFTVLATFVLIVALKLLASAFRRFRDSYLARLKESKSSKQIEQMTPDTASKIRRGVGYTLGFLYFIFVCILIDIYITFVLRLFPTTQKLSEQYFEFVISPVVVLWNATVNYLPNALEIIVLSTLTFLGLKILRFFSRALEAGALKIPGFYPDWAEPTYKLLRALVLVFLLVGIYPLLPGANEKSFKAISIFVGAILSLGSTTAIRNTIAGVVLIYTRAFQVGDWVQVNQSTGIVVWRTLLVTRLRSANNEQITIPNGEVLRDQVVNFTPAMKRGRLGFSTTISIGYDVDWRTVKELLLKAAASTPAISSVPSPFVSQTNLDDFYVRYELRVFTSGPPPLSKIKSMLGQNILDVFNQAGVEIRSPHVFEASMSADQRIIPNVPDQSS